MEKQIELSRLGSKLDVRNLIMTHKTIDRLDPPLKLNGNIDRIWDTIGETMADILLWNQRPSIRKDFFNIVEKNVKTNWHASIRDLEGDGVQVYRFSKKENGRNIDVVTIDDNYENARHKDDRREIRRVETTVKSVKRKYTQRNPELKESLERWERVAIPIIQTQLTFDGS